MNAVWHADGIAHSAAVNDLVLVPAARPTTGGRAARGRPGAGGADIVGRAAAAPPPSAPPSSSLVWSASDDGSVRVWAVAGGRVTLDGPPVVATQGPPAKCLCTYQGLVWVGFDNGTVRAWHAANRAMAGGDVAHGGKPVHALAPCGKAVWSGGADGSLQVGAGGGGEGGGRGGAKVKRGGRGLS